VLAGGPKEKCLFARPNYVLSVARCLSGKACTGKESLRNLWVIWLNGGAPPKTLLAALSNFVHQVNEN
jgi:hypothetical protein